METESAFVATISIVASLLGGYLARRRIDLGVFGGGEIYGLPLIAAILSAFGGALLGIILFNAPMLILCLLIWVSAIGYAIKRGLSGNKGEDWE